MISPTRVKDYFIEHNPKFADDFITVDFIDIGNVNFIYKISTPKGIFYLKHGLSHERKKTIYTDYFELRNDRLRKEVNSIKFLRENLPSFKEVFPIPIYFNERDNIFIMGDIAEGRELLRDNLMGGVTDLNIVEFLAKLIAQQHNLSTTGMEDDTFFKDLLYFRTVLSAKELEADYKQKVKDEYEGIINEGHKYFVNGDFSPKHIYYNKDQVGICDLEFCCLGDPIYDIGFFLAHYKLASIINPKITGKTEHIAKFFVKTYLSQIKIGPDKKQFEKRLNFYIGTGMLNRIDAVPRERQISEETINRIRLEAKKLLD